MKQFIDNTGAAWGLEITLGAARRVLKTLDVDLLDPASKTGDLTVSQRLLYDDLFLSDVIAAILEPQIKERGLENDAFFERIDGATLKQVEAAFWEEYQRFFEARGKEWAAKAIRLDLETKEANAQVALEKIDGLSSTASPVESESTPTA